MTLQEFYDTLIAKGVHPNETIMPSGDWSEDDSEKDVRIARESFAVVVYTA